MKRSGSADLASMGGDIPYRLLDRMTKLSLPIVESIVLEYGKQDFLRRLSDLALRVTRVYNHPRVVNRKF
ncbi:MAG: DUF763 domain-containing protein [Leadbetterella sp.]